MSWNIICRASIVAKKISLAVRLDLAAGWTGRRAKRCRLRWQNRCILVRLVRMGCGRSWATQGTEGKLGATGNILVSPTFPSTVQNRDQKQISVAPGSPRWHRQTHSDQKIGTQKQPRSWAGEANKRRSREQSRWHRNSHSVIPRFPRQKTLLSSSVTDPGPVAPTLGTESF